MKPQARVPPGTTASLLPVLPDFIQQKTAEMEEPLVYAPDVAASIKGLAAQLNRFESIPRALLFGEPGVGKSATLLNLTLASQRPFWWVRADQMFSAFLGGTSSNLSTVFAAAAKAHAVLVFDDFDAIARKRADPRESGETRRVVTALLAALDDSRDSIPVLAATNLPEVVDSAIIRRFNVLIPFAPLPRAEVLSLLRGVTDADADAVTDDIITLAEMLSPAEIVDIAKSSERARGSADKVHAKLLERTQALRLIRGGL
jgi:SpoVK/Ycf46/Vps4 family AAA+-type ATPase